MLADRVMLAAVWWLSVAPAGVAAECGCETVEADSFAEAGSCVVRESSSRYCTLDWRHGDILRGSQG
jgi:hypothetical protein